MYRKLILLAVSGLVFGTATSRTLELVEGAYEAVLADVTFPATTTGTIFVRLCATCDTHALPVDANTSYIGSTGPMSLDDFLTNVAEIRLTPNGNAMTAVGVFYDLETDRTTRVSLHPH